MTGGDLKDRSAPQAPSYRRRPVDAVSKGTLDGGHGVLVYHYGKQNALALWGSGPAYGMDGNMLLSWHKYGGGRELPEQALRFHRRKRGLLSLWTASHPAAGLVQEADHQDRGLQGSQVPHRGHFDRRVHRLGRGGQRAAGGGNRSGDDRGLLDAAEFNNAAPTACSVSPTSPRCACCRATTRTPSSSRSPSTKPSTTRCRTR